MKSLVVGFFPGSATDTSARLLAPKFAELWGQPEMLIEISGRSSYCLTTWRGRRD